MIFLRRHLSLRYEIEGLYRKEILEIPPEALREALLNAVMHRDYHFDTARISLEIYRDRIEISSPGGLPPGLKPEEFGHKSVHRNRLIAEMFQRLGEVERAGSGIKKMRDALRNAGLPPPRFRFTTFFTITFRRARILDAAWPKAQVEAQVEAQVRSSRLAMNILRHCTSPISSSSLVRQLKHARRSGGFQVALELLLKNGLIDYTIPEKPKSSKQKYVITEKGNEILSRIMPASKH